jgi:hypothetical protein
MPDITLIRHKRQGLFIAVLICTLLLSLPPVFSQNETRILLSGVTTTGTVEVDATATSYVFDATVGTTATMIVTSKNAQPLGILLSDPDGAPIAQAVDTAGSGTVQISDALMPANGRYFVVVYFAPQATEVVASEFDIIISFNEIAPPVEATPTIVPTVVETVETPPQDIPEQVLIAGGIEVSFSWTGASDMNLQVRDPSGGTLYWDSRATTNGGSFGFDANGLCELISDNPVETATWAPGFLPTGSYEILIFYREACEATVGSVPFTVSVSVDGVESGSVDGVLLPPVQGQNSVYLSRFVIAGDGTATVSPGNAYPDSSINNLPTGFDIAGSPTISIDRNVPLVGNVTNNQPFNAYSFTAIAGEIVSIDLQAVTSSLDTLVQVVDATGVVVGVNDDSGGSTDSFISNLRLLNDGTYTIIATRYGKVLGGTEGQYQLILSGPSDDLPPELTDLQFPQGDIEVTLIWNTSADLQLLVRDPVGEAVFDDVPFINSGGILEANGNVNCVPAETLSPASYIYWPTGRIRPGTYEIEVWYQNACVDVPPPVEFTLVLEVAGETIIVERQLPLVDQRYVTNFTIDPSGSVEAGLGGFLGGSETLPYQPEVLSAPVLISGQPVTGVITPSNTFDVYSFEGITGESVTIRLSASSQTLDTNLFLISPSGIEIAANDDGDPISLGATGRTTDSILSEIILPENGPYAIIATRFGTINGGTIGGYSLTMRKN